MNLEEIDPALSRLSCDLHDTLGPALAAIRLRLDTAVSLLEHDPRIRALVADAAAEAARTGEEMRRLLPGCGPDDAPVGLPHALRRLTGGLDDADVAVHADLTDPGPLSVAVELAAYRIAAEGLANAIRHAGARRVAVRLDVGPDHLVLEVRDDGVGLTGSARGLGLWSMVERAREVGGHCDIRPRPDGRQGTEVRAVLPRTGSQREAA